jgi:transporter family-2 protein
MKWGFMMLALAVGCLVPVQAGVNSRLRAFLGGDPVTAAFVSFFVGAVVLGAWVLAARPPFFLRTAAFQAPWWVWTGGFLGAFFVTSTIVLARELGALAMVALIIASQLTASLVIDHYGWIGYDVRPVSWTRIAGILLLVAGALLVQRK